MLALLRDDPEFTLYVLADSIEGVARLSRAATEAGLARPLALLVELGIPGKRAGCRTPEAALDLARAIAQAPALALAGFEGYEGLLTSQDGAADTLAVGAFVAGMANLVRAADADGLFDGPAILLSAGGSAYFDLVARGFAGVGALSYPLQAILRSGCYLTSDHGSYRRLIGAVDAREGAPAPGLQAALEVWSMVLSRPEPDLAILSMGKRDASYDMELPLAPVPPPPWPRRTLPFLCRRAAASSR